MHISFTMLDLKRLRLLRELATRETIGAVARELDYSPSAVSQQLAQLEKEAGVPLFERVGRNLRLTAAAQQLVLHADVILAHVEEAEADLQATADLITGTRARGGDPVRRPLPARARAATGSRDEHPALRVEVTDAEPETSMPSLALGSLDMVLADQYPFLPRAPDPRLDLEPLHEEHFHVVLPREHPLARPGPRPDRGAQGRGRGRSARRTRPTRSWRSAPAARSAATSPTSATAPTTC